jgi:tetratricopeptide (TPR) repeat protein
MQIRPRRRATRVDLCRARRPCRFATGMLLFALAPLASACAPALPGPGAPSPEEVAGYEARLASDPANPAILVPLAAAYRDAGRTEESRVLLERALEQRPDDAGAVLLLGLTYEDLGRMADAAAQYHRYVDLSRSPGLRARIQGRARVVQRQAWQASARAALEQEAELAAAEPEPRTVAVFPFLFQGWDEELRPLGRAVAELVITDLAQVRRLRVLERARVQLLLDEVRLGDEGLTDPATAVRGGRLLGAERVVQGRIGGVEEAMELQAAVVSVGAAPDAPVRPVSEQDAARRLFDMQKRLVLGLFPSLGIELTPAERARIARRPTENLQALLYYGMGLETEDRGAYLEASGYFSHATTLDAGFGLARIRAESAARAAEAVATSTAELTGQAFAAFGAAEAGLAAVAELVPIAGGRNAASEALGQETIGSQGGLLRIIVRTRPGGGS